MKNILFSQKGLVGGDVMKAIISKNFLKGYIRVLDLYGTKEWPELSNSKQKDYEALRSDWENVGNSIWRETRNFERAQA